MKTALISVYNKEGIVEFAKQLAELDFQILASAGTAKVLNGAGIKTSDVANIVGGEPILGHRVVTLSREIHAGLLARDTDEDRKELHSLGIPWIDLVCVDLYPLEEEIGKWDQETLTRPSGTLSQGEREEMNNSIIEKTDIGGPAILRSAAKGRRLVICDPADRKIVIDWLKNGQPDNDQFISNLAAKAEFVAANYALVSARYHSQGKYDGILGSEIAQAKYGENAWQVPAGLYGWPTDDKLSLLNFSLLAGSQPSYNNWADVDRLLQTITHLAAGYDLNYGKVPYIAVGVKHGNPCGAAVEDDPQSTVKNMLEGDLRAIFGGLVIVNFEINEELADILLTYKTQTARRLLDGIIAPSFTIQAVAMLKRKGDKCRFLVNPVLSVLSKASLDSHRRFRYVRGGFLRQPNYTFVLDFKSSDIETIGEPTFKQFRDLILAWAIGSTSNSNTVTLVKDRMLLGNGAGQQDRVGGAELAIKRAINADHKIEGAVAYSDSFFPFVDGVKVLAQAGVKAIFATSGSVKDQEIKDFCQNSHINLIMMPDTKARGFFGH